MVREMEAKVLMRASEAVTYPDLSQYGNVIGSLFGYILLLLHHRRMMNLSVDQQSFVVLVVRRC